MKKETIRVTLDAANAAHVRRLARGRRRVASDIIRTLICTGLARAPALPWPEGRRVAATSYLVRFDPDTSAALRERAERTGRPVTWVADGLIEMARQPQPAVGQDRKRSHRLSA